MSQSMSKSLNILKEEVYLEQENNQGCPEIADAYIFVDLETGGLNPDKHTILQIAAVITDLDLKIQDSFITYVKPHPKLETTKDALAINQIKLADLESAPDEPSVARALHQFAHIGGKRARFAGYNCKFDLTFLNNLWQRHDIFEPPYLVPWLDVYDLAKTKFTYDAGLPNFKLVTVAAQLGIDTSGAHNAGADITMTIEVARRLRALPDRSGAAILETSKF